MGNYLTSLNTSMYQPSYGYSNSMISNSYGSSALFGGNCMNSGYSCMAPQVQQQDNSQAFLQQLVLLLLTAALQKRNQATTTTVDETIIDDTANTTTVNTQTKTAAAAPPIPGIGILSGDTGTTVASLLTGGLSDAFSGW